MQKVTKAKKDAMNMWETSGRQTGKQGGKESSSTAKARAKNELLEELETPEGERKITRIANARHKMTKDFTKNNQIKDEQRVVGTWIRSWEDGRDILISC